MKKLWRIVYKSFVRPNFDNADIICDKPFNEVFKNKLEMVQHCAALVINGAFKGCVRYIFTSLFLSLNEGTCQIKKNVFYFTPKPLCSRENQILEFCIFKFNAVIKCLSIKQEKHFTE